MAIMLSRRENYCLISCNTITFCITMVQGFAGAGGTVWSKIV
ncbi:MAG: hypothetical protein PUI38_05445 [Candidatus Treponema excrementipullorum]|nr:hypothetical protein [Candidatus Treponema excrementipullorum]MDY4708361.1 hypothetical protein [Candidatus Treponema excrementipullorum]